MFCNYCLERSHCSDSALCHFRQAEAGRGGRYISDCCTFLWACSICVLINILKDNVMVRNIKLWFKWSEVAQSCPSLCDPVDCSLQGSSVHGIVLTATSFLHSDVHSKGNYQTSPPWQYLSQALEVREGCQLKYRIPIKYEFHINDKY